MKNHTQSTLAKTLGVSRQLVSAHAKKPDAPKLSDVAGWKEFLAAAGRAGSLPPDLRAKIGHERLRLTKAKADIVEHERDRTTGAGAESMIRPDVERLLKALGESLHVALRQGHMNVAHHLVGLSASEIATELVGVALACLPSALAGLESWPDCDGKPPKWALEMVRRTWK